jgi:predicted metal-binding protein
LLKGDAVKSSPKSIQTLMEATRRAGASAAAVIAAGDIVSEDRFADMCREPRCENYGLSPGCPPHVAGPAAFRQQLELFRRAIFFRLDVPAEVLFSSERCECFQLLHEIAAGVERQAVDMGFKGARAYAGGSCKQLFCFDHPECRVLSKNGACRHPQAARPSMSGYGIHVARLVVAAGWPVKGIDPGTAAAGRSENIYGLVLID